MRDREYDNYFENCFKQLCSGREEHEFVHFNRSMGIKIHGKQHYKAELKARGMVPFDEAERLAEQWDKEHPHQSYDTLSPRALDIVRSLQMSADSDGNIKLGGRAIQAMKEIGAIGSSEHAPKEYQTQGGFNG
jgi:hypothetical protein